MHQQRVVRVIIRAEHDDSIARRLASEPLLERRHVLVCRDNVAFSCDPVSAYYMVDGDQIPALR